MAEYINIITVCSVAATLFFGGFLSPLPFIPDGIWWFALKVFILIFAFMWIRGTFPRMRYDQLHELYLEGDAATFAGQYPGYGRHHYFPAARDSVGYSRLIGC